MQLWWSPHELSPLFVGDTTLSFSAQAKYTQGYDSLQNCTWANTNTDTDRCSRSHETAETFFNRKTWTRQKDGQTLKGVRSVPGYVFFSGSNPPLVCGLSPPLWQHTYTTMVGETVGNTHTETYNWAEKRSRTREGVNLQCESVKFFFCNLQYLSSDVSATTAATVVATVTSVVPGWKQKLYLPANFHACASGHTHTLKA